MIKSDYKCKEYGLRQGLVSVVTPVYNGEGHLARMLESVLSQSYDYIEMILIDDGSTDQTVSVAEDYCKKFSDRGYSYRIVRASHKCASAAINSGLPYVTGEYLIWPDSDDILEPESVKRRVLFLQNHPEYHCVRSLSYYFNAETGEKQKNRDEKTGDLTREDLFWDILEFKTFVCCGCYMLKSESFFKIYSERHIPEYNVGQNFQMLLPFMYFHKCPTIQEELYGVFVRKGSHSRKYLTRKDEIKKYQFYEMLVDDIVKICSIRDKASIQRIIKWKAGRRKQIALKYNIKVLYINAQYHLYRCKEIGFGQFSKEIALVYYNDLKEKWRLCKMVKRQILAQKEIDRVYFCKKKMVALTFDAAWGNKYTSLILDELDKNKVNATFFINGSSIKMDLETNRQIALKGHELGNFCYGHPHMLILSENQVDMEVEITQQLIKGITGSNTRLFRFPYGESNKYLIKSMRKKGFVSVSWTIDSMDWQKIGVEQIYKNVVKSYKLKNGSIILMNRSGEHTVEALKQIIPELKEMGYEIVPISVLLSAVPLYRYLL